MKGVPIGTFRPDDEGWNQLGDADQRLRNRRLVLMNFQGRNAHRRWHIWKLSVYGEVPPNHAQLTKKQQGKEAKVDGGRNVDYFEEFITFDYHPKHSGVDAHDKKTLLSNHMALIYNMPLATNWPWPVRTNREELDGL